MVLQLRTHQGHGVIQREHVVDTAGHWGGGVIATGRGCPKELVGRAAARGAAGQTNGVIEGFGEGLGLGLVIDSDPT